MAILRPIKIAMVMSSLACNGAFAQEVPKVDVKRSMAATTEQKKSYHVVFTETVTSKLQRDWTDVYNADVEVIKDGKSLGKFKGSTLPNFKPKKNDPSYVYSVVISTGSLKRALKQERYFTWKRDVRAQKDENGNERLCLRLASEVPTLNVGTERNVDKLKSELIHGSVKGNFEYATSILVHSGNKEWWRGSAGCLTIKPSDAEAFFKLFPVDSTGTLSLYRGIDDAETNMCYDY